ncbi:MAG TPA: hypothetical protein VGT41_00780 [Candidatus Babeliales bacterium]|nr:hypothetical protein [Candidatus Babeliales bacterium]
MKKNILRTVLKLNLVSLIFSNVAFAIKPSSYAEGAKGTTEQITLDIQSPITYAEIGEQLLASYGIINNTASSTETENNDPKDQTIDFNIPQLCDKEALQQLYSLIGEETLSPTINYQTVRTLIKDLELFYATDSNDHTNHLFSCIDRTQTVFGRAELAAWLAQPTNNIELLQKRQNAVRTIAENPALMDELSTFIAHVKKSTSALFNNWNKEHDVITSLIKNLYPKAFSKFFSTRTAPLEVYTRLGNLNTAYSMFSSCKLLSYPIYIWLGLKATNAATQYAVETDLCPTPPISKIMEVAKLLTSKYAGTMRSLTDVQKHSKLFYLMVAGAHGAAALYVYLTAKAQAELLKVPRLDAHLTNYMQTNLIGMGSIVQAVEKTHALEKKHPELTKGLTQKSFRKGSKNFLHLATMLQKNTFTGSASFFSCSGRVLAAHTLLQSCKQEFTKYMHAVGEIDALVSLAKLVNESKNKPVQYCFVTYMDQDTPYLQLTNFWNPLVGADHAVPNSLTMGNTENANGPRGIVLTGTNTGGKSTALKAILFSTLLAHTCGIAAAQQVALTPFAYIGSSLNIIDSITAGKSLSQAEAERIAFLIKHARALKNKEFGIVINDELFHGLAARTADEETYKCIQYLLECLNLLHMTATHTDRATNLEKETNGLSQNYRMEAYINEQEEVVRPFILEPGINRYHIGSHIVQTAIKNA